jgi:hypothetical protein
MFMVKQGTPKSHCDFPFDQYTLKKIALTDAVEKNRFRYQPATQVDSPSDYQPATLVFPPLAAVVAKSRPPPISSQTHSKTLGAAANVAPVTNCLRIEAPTNPTASISGNGGFVTKPQLSAGAAMPSILHFAAGNGRGGGGDSVPILLGKMANAAALCSQQMTLAMPQPSHSSRYNPYKRPKCSSSSKTFFISSISHPNFACTSN